MCHNLSPPPPKKASRSGPGHKKKEDVVLFFPPVIIKPAPARKRVNPGSIGIALLTTWPLIQNASQPRGARETSGKLISTETPGGRFKRVIR